MCIFFSNAWIKLSAIYYFPKCGRILSFLRYIVTNIVIKKKKRGRDSVCGFVCVVKVSADVRSGNTY